MHAPLDLARGGEEGGWSSLLQVVPASDRRRCRVSRNRSPPMPRGGRTVARWPSFIIVITIMLMIIIIFVAINIAFVLFPFSFFFVFFFLFSSLSRRSREPRQLEMSATRMEDKAIVIS